MHPILQKLRKGDRRSIGRSKEVVADVLANPRLFRIVFSGLFVDDPGIRMRSADVLEKVTTRRPELLRPHKKKLIRELATTDQKEIRWHLAQMIPRLELNAQQRRHVNRALLSYLTDRSSIVRTFAMQALVDIAKDAPTLMPAVRRRIIKLTNTGTPAMRARGRKLLATF